MKSCRHCRAQKFRALQQCGPTDIRRNFHGAQSFPPAPSFPIYRELLERISGALGEHHAGDLKRESAEARAERIIAAELRRLGWTAADLPLRLKSDPAKLQIAARLRAETTLTIKSIAARLHLGTPKSANVRIHPLKKNPKPEQKENVMV